MSKKVLNVDSELLLSTDNDHDEYSRAIYNSLPPNAQKYFKEKTSYKLDKIVSQLSTVEIAKKYACALCIFPLFCMRYANSNQLLPVIINGKHKLLKGPIFHWQTGLTDRIGKPVDITNDVIFGSIKLVYVSPGCLKFALNSESSLPLLLGPGLHFFDDSSIIVQESPIRLNSNGKNQIINVNSSNAFSFVFVQTGSQGIVNCRNGGLKILEAGLHFVEAPDNFAQFVSIQQEHFKFGSCDVGTPVFLTADNVELHVDATLFYNTSDVKQVYTTMIKDSKDLYETLHSQAMSTLRTIIRTENFSNIGKKKMDKIIGASGIGILTAKDDEVVMAYPVGQSKDTLENVTNGFQSIICDAGARFKNSMQLEFGDRIGITFQSLRIEKIEFADKVMQKQVSELAMMCTKLSTQEATITAQRKVEVAQAERESATQIIRAKMEADKNMIAQDNQNEMTIRKTKIQNDLMISCANTKAEATKIDTAAQASNIIMLASANAKSALEIGNSEVEIIKKKSELPNYALRIMTESQEQTLKGVQKVIYTNQMPFLMQNPMSPFPVEPIDGSIHLC